MGGLRAKAGLIAAACVLALTGCVDRRYVVTSNAPGTQVTVDGESFGPTPLDASFVYAGKRRFHLYAPNYEPLSQDVNFEPKWFDYPGLDLFAEVFWPFRIEDVRRVHFDLQPATPIAVPDLQAKAEALRARAANLPPASVPDDQTGPERTKTAAGAVPQTTGSTPIPQVVPGRFNGR